MRRETRQVSLATLRRMPLPALSSNSDKDARGRVLVAGGSAAVPGAVLLAGVAALRSGAGKLQLATVRESAPGLGLAVPEALIVALPPTRAGEIAAARAVTALRPHATTADAVLLGPGMLPNRACHRLVAAIVRLLRGDATLVLDAGALIALRGHEQILMPLGGRAVLTPHAGEMAAVLGIEKRDVEAAAPDAARLAADRFGAVVALKGADTWIAEPNGGLLHYRGGSVGLATSGSGDTLAGIIAGIAARGAPALPAAVWGVWAHGTAGQRLARRMAKVGFLARELLAEVPSLVGRD